MGEILMHQHFDPVKVEKEWYKKWLDSGIFAPSKDKDSPAYSIVIPPPNVTGSLHMGHALNVTIQDILCRWKRMSGQRVLWVPGTDHAGIATQNVVEREIEKEGLSRFDLGREGFIERVWQWKKEYGGRIVNQLKALGASCDWSAERFTLDEGLSNAVRKVFVQLFSEGLIYRAQRLINWCPRCHTALSDLEVDHAELNGTLTYIRYPLKEKGRFIVVATTRPETMLGDTAVAVHPDDERYKGLIGKSAGLPLTGRVIPIVADTAVDSTFGTGAVKVTPSHDFNDEAIANRQNPALPFITVIGDDGRMTAAAGAKYAGMDRFECRKQVLKDLLEGGFLEKHHDHLHAVGTCYRCKTVIEPLPAAQWYVNVRDMANSAMDAVRTGHINIVPEGWNNSYFSWMENIKDWCISRQIWWGHRIPVWYCPKCTGANDGISHGDKISIVIVTGHGGSSISSKEGTYNELRASGLTHDEIIGNVSKVRIGVDVTPHCGMADIMECPVCKNRELLRDIDVLDTWFSSALWPFSTMGWPANSERLRDFYPTSVLVTGFDILFFWVARMVMMGLKFMGDVPFRDVYIHALVRDAHGQKMSKSKGNVIDPLLMIDKFGADSFRFALAAFAAQGRDVRFSEERVEGYRHFVNKLWNASKFILQYVDEKSLDAILGIELDINDERLTIPDRWILSRLSITASEIDRHLTGYRFNDAANSIYQFIWHEFCDWHIELSKTVLKGGVKGIEDGDPAALTVKTLLHILEMSLKLLHPFMPFVTEELFSSIFRKGKSISMARYPNNLPMDEESINRMQYLLDAINGIRSIKGELNISPAKRLKAMVRPVSDKARGVVSDGREYIMTLARLDELEIIGVSGKQKGCASTVRSELEIHVPLFGLFDPKTETARLNKELKKIDESLAALDKKLFNEDFISRAPQEVVQKEKERYDDLISKKKKLSENIQSLSELSESL